MKLIDADALMKELEREVDLADDWKTAHEIANVVKYFPTIEPQRMRGKWMYKERIEPRYDFFGVKTWAIAYQCSDCGFVHTVIENFGRYQFCPNCGADMRGDSNG